MVSASPNNKRFIILCLTASLLSIAMFVYRNDQSFYQTPIDFLIFLRAGEAYQQTGQLYQRANNYADMYHPSAAIFKFPPAFQLMLAPLTKLPASINLYIFTRLLLTGMYILSVALLFYYLQKNLSLKGIDRIYFGSLLVIISCWLMPFFECIRWLLTEIPLLLLFTLSFLLLTKNKWLASTSGLLIAYAACAKIYPAFLFGHHILQKNKASLWGIALGILLTLLASVYIYGVPEHLFYIQHILPVLMNEQVTDKWVNLNIEKFLFIVGIIPEISGKIFQLSRLLVVGGLIVMLYLFRKVAIKNEFLIFALFITTMFFCFPNYWPQYQIFLIIPITYLLAAYIKSGNKTGLAIVLLTSAILFIPDLLWQTILNWDVARQNLDIELIGKESYQHGTSITLLKYSPLTWFSYYAYECRALVPIIFYFLLGLNLLQSSKNRSA